jgi:hypothetical protein
MTRPFGIWCQRGRNLEEWCVIFWGSSPLCMHLELLHCCTCMFNFSHAWTLVGLWLDCNNLWVFVDCVVVEN